MRQRVEKVDRYVDRLLRGRRPWTYRTHQPRDRDLPVIRTAISLVAAGSRVPHPREAFVADLRQRLAAQERGAAPDTMRERVPPRPAARRIVRRRRFLTVAALSGTAAAGAATSRAMSLRVGRGHGAPPAEASLTPARGSWQHVAEAASLPEGGVMPFDLADFTGFVHRSGGHLRAVSGFCTHQGCRLSIADSADQLVCPCHGAVFTPTGTALSRLRGFHGLADLPRLAVRVRNGQIEVYAPISTLPDQAAWRGR